MTNDSECRHIATCKLMQPQNYRKKYKPAGIHWLHSLLLVAILAEGHCMAKVAM